ncbi:sensor histidine kinase [Vagococcus intermedius]|uniref:histidine kinase n=1 Tax=Vagococcus intermedius TaxID=2991418 RepID=A0AAF0CVX4_9ENTE|nr:HAMP domain-containing sensor histidine kinase [Vagococcus intermedius]WEG74005.1 HAMP domain-containing histidine kinase [Vagococcus intermedius]WEG76085.1 HAMP domain-containing histidine kinase [Vagococcus intermedius]
MSKSKKISQFSLTLIGIVLLFVGVTFLIDHLPLTLSWWLKSGLSGLLWLGIITLIGYFLGGSERQFYKVVTHTLFEMGRGNFAIDLSSEKKKMARFDEWVTFLNQIEKTSDNLAKMEALKQSFISNVSHEIRSPLTSISGFSQLALNEKDERKRAYYLENIQGECMRLSHLSESLLKLTELEETNVLQKSQIDLSELLKQVVNGFQIQLIEKKIEINLKLAPISYQGEPVLFYQIWQNLLGNAIKFSTSGSIVKLEVSGTDEAWAITLIDQGIGMSKENVTHIFNRFYKVDKARNSDIEGNGLGLAIVKEIVTLHEDLTLEVCSDLSVGTTFTLNKH